MSFVFAENINPYLVNAQDVIVTARKQPICNVPEMIYGSKPADGGFLLLNENEKEEIIKKSPMAQKWIRPFIGAKEFVNREKRWCLDARKLYPGSTLADLYDPNTMPPELVKAHEKLDNAVKAAYGNEGFETEEEVVSSLMKLYKEAIDKENAEKKSIS